MSTTVAPVAEGTATAVARLDAMSAPLRDASQEWGAGFGAVPPCAERTYMLHELTAGAVAMLRAVGEFLPHAEHARHEEPGRTLAATLRDGTAAMLDMLGIAVERVEHDPYIDPTARLPLAALRSLATVAAQALDELDKRGPTERFHALAATFAAHRGALDTLEEWLAADERAGLHRVAPAVARVARRVWERLVLARVALRQFRPPPTRKPRRPHRTDSRRPRRVLVAPLGAHAPPALTA